jgi:hypothetical protein
MLPYCHIEKKRELILKLQQVASGPGDEADEPFFGHARQGRSAWRLGWERTMHAERGFDEALCLAIVLWKMVVDGVNTFPASGLTLAMANACDGTRSKAVDLF